MDRSMLIKDYIKQLNIEDDIQTGNTNNGIYFKQIMRREIYFELIIKTKRTWLLISNFRNYSQWNRLQRRIQWKIREPKKLDVKGR